MKDFWIYYVDKFFTAVPAFQIFLFLSMTRPSIHILDDPLSFLIIKPIVFSCLQHNVWLDDALDRAKQLYLSHYRAMPKSLERATAHRLMRAMFNSEERFIEPSPEAIEKLTLPIVREAVMKQLVPSNMEVR